jgi:ABC-type lipoprotein release transport system permease subunit
MASRNLARNLRRSVLTVLAITLGLAAMIFLWGFSDGLHSNMRGNFQDTIIGSAQVHRDGFFRRPELSRHIEDADQVVAAIERQGVARWTRRLESFVLASGPESSTGLLLIGVDPVRELLVTRLAEKVTRGRFFVEDDGLVCVLGEGAVRNLNVGLGDPVTVVAYDRFGSLVAEQLTLVGIVTSGELGVDRGLIVTPLAPVQEMLEMQDRVTDIPIRVDDRKLAQIIEALRHDLLGQGYEVLPWYDMFPVMNEWVTLHDGFLYVFFGVVLFLVVAGVLSTVLLSMLERIREFGMLKALGTKSWEIAILVSLESLIMGLIGTAVGTILGLALVAITAHIGIDLSGLLGLTTRFYVDPVIRPEISAEHLPLTLGAVLLTTLLAGLYPAYRTATLEPAEAIRRG